MEYGVSKRLANWILSLVHTNIVFMLIQLLELENGIFKRKKKRKRKTAGNFVLYSWYKTEDAITIMHAVSIATCVHLHSKKHLLEKGALYILSKNRKLE